MSLFNTAHTKGRVRYGGGPLYNLTSYFYPNILPFVITTFEGRVHIVSVGVPPLPIFPAAKPSTATTSFIYRERGHPFPTAHFLSQQEFQDDLTDKKAQRGLHRQIVQEGRGGEAGRGPVCWIIGTIGMKILYYGTCEYLAWLRLT